MIRAVPEIILGGIGNNVPDHQPAEHTSLSIVPIPMDMKFSFLPPIPIQTHFTAYTLLFMPKKSYIQDICS